MWRCCVLSVCKFCAYKQHFASKCCVRNVRFIGHVSSGHRLVSTHSLQDQGDDESSLVKVGRDVGLKPSSVVKAVEYSPVLARASHEQLKRFFSCMRENGLNCEYGLALLTEKPSLLALNPSKFSESLEHWRNCQLGDQNLKRLLASHLNLVLIPTREIGRRIPLLNYLCGTNRRNLYNLLLSCPQVMVENWTALQNKIDYLEKVMKVKKLKIAKTMALNQSFETIRKRHVFLERCGRYVAPNPKVNPLVASKNPTLRRITDTSDKEFATKVAGVTLEEYEVFCDLFAEQVEDEVTSYDSDSDDENNSSN